MFISLVFFSWRPFLLVVDFPRSSFRLCTASVGLALRACIGGSPADLHVSHLKDRSFSFTVCSKSVGLWIYNLRSYFCNDYHARFFLWRDGGPNWRREWYLWTTEQQSEWTVVTRKSNSRKVPNHIQQSASTGCILKSSSVLSQTIQVNHKHPCQQQFKSTKASSLMVFWT